MKFKSIIKNSLIITLLSPTFALAQQIACPSVEIIKNSADKLDTLSKIVYQEKSSFFVFSLFNTIFDQNNLFTWAIASPSIEDEKISDFNSAYSVGQNNIKNTFVAENAYAIEIENGYMCFYNNNLGESTAIAVTGKDPNSQPDIKKAILGLKHR